MPEIVRNNRRESSGLSRSGFHDPMTSVLSPKMCSLRAVRYLILQLLWRTLFRATVRLWGRNRHRLRRQYAECVDQPRPISGIPCWFKYSLVSIVLFAGYTHCIQKDRSEGFRIPRRTQCARTRVQAHFETRLRRRECQPSLR